jgi:hypothetical protein
MNRLLKDNVALIAVLEAADGVAGPGDAARGKQLICVANTHIHANPELSDVKLWQVHTLLKGLEKIANRWGGQGGGVGRGVARGGEVEGSSKFDPLPASLQPSRMALSQPSSRATPPTCSADIPMLVAGDFNSTPGSAAHSLLVRGRVEPSQLVRPRARERRLWPPRPLARPAKRAACRCLWRPHSSFKCHSSQVWRPHSSFKPHSSPPPLPPLHPPQPPPQDPSMDPLHLLRDQKLAHALPLSSAYAALWDQPPTSEALRRQRGRLDASHHEPLFTNFSRCGPGGGWAGRPALPAETAAPATSHTHPLTSPLKGLQGHAGLHPVHPRQPRAARAAGAARGGRGLLAPRRRPAQRQLEQRPHQPHGGVRHPRRRRMSARGAPPLSRRRSRRSARAPSGTAPAARPGLSPASPDHRRVCATDWLLCC